jgi:hypothetical protein
MRDTSVNHRKEDEVRQKPCDLAYIIFITRTAKGLKYRVIEKDRRDLKPL